ncbi:hypothetical protein BQ8420_02065 [Nocardiopsis sp. JB363]|nr:hypothetical protein BQ8420_02065 [Nocardiopsis sp. JB363]
MGVAATGVAIARAERQRRAYTPDQVRERLHARVALIGRGEDGGATAVEDPPVGRARALWRRLSRRVSGPR